MKLWRNMTAAAALLATGLAGAALAQDVTTYRIDPNAPLKLNSDEGKVNPDNCTVAMKGRAEVVQDRARLRAQEITAYQEKVRSGCGDITRVEGKGQVFYVTPAETIRADAAVYEPTKDVATFTGNVVAVRGKNVSATDRLVINISTGAAQMNGSFRAVIYPKSKSGPAQ